MKINQAWINKRFCIDDLNAGRKLNIFADRFYFIVHDENDAVVDDFSRCDQSALERELIRGRLAVRSEERPDRYRGQKSNAGSNLPPRNGNAFHWEQRH